MWGFPSLDSIVQDARYGVRQMRRAPWFTAVAVSSLAIGIGASAAVFSLADSLLFRKLAVPDPDSLVLLDWKSGPVFPFSSLNGNGQQNDEGLASTSFALTAFQTMHPAGQGTVDLFAFADLYAVSIAIDGRAEMSSAHAVSGNYFDALGVPPETGPTLAAADNQPDAPPAAMISDALWSRRFGRSPDVVGRPVVYWGALLHPRADTRRRGDGRGARSRRAIRRSANRRRSGDVARGVAR